MPKWHHVEEEVFQIGRYQIAIYIRLSKEDRKPYGRKEEMTAEPAAMPCSKKGESNSIAMQRILLRNYVAENFTDYELHEFCDDGYTGTNFQRPGMQAMLEMVRNGGLHCIIVKDFSRFARDYIELGSYLEQIFPFLGVRFISVNDGYDSRNYRGSPADIDVNFKNLLYDLYSKDLSGKVRSSLAVRKEKGQYVSANSPFGYEKAPQDRHALLIAEDEAQIVRRIYALAMEGHTSSQIAKLLNGARVKTPIEFKIEKGKTHRIPKGERFLWSSSTVCQILRNEAYIGNIVQKKYTKDIACGKNHLNPREEWLVTYNHHEPIIDKAVFYKIQEGRGKKKGVPRRQVHAQRKSGDRNANDKGNMPRYQPHPLARKLVCGCCKRNLRYRTGLNPYFSCPYCYSDAMGNCVRKVNAMFLEQAVLQMIQDRLQEGGACKKCCVEDMCQSGTDIADGPMALSKEATERYIDKIVVSDEQQIEIQWKENAFLQPAVI